MAKRSATTDLNHDNWDDPVEEEEAGAFKAASDETLQKRVIKQARRRLKPSENSESNLFSKFTGFKPNTVNTNSTGSNKPFGFLGAVTSSANTALTSNGAAVTSTTAKTDPTPQETYVANLQVLNRSVADWINTHVDANPVCILTPVFKDYETHLERIQSERDGGKSSSTSNSSTSTFTLPSSTISNSNKFSINIPVTSESSKKTMTFTDISSSGTIKTDATKETGKSPLLQASVPNKPASLSIFNVYKSESTGSNLPTKPDPATLMKNPFLSGLKKEDKSETSPFSLNSNPAPISSNTKEEEEEESDEPPKVELPPIEEENAVFSKRCKVFVKKDGSFKDKGVGMLFIKKVGEEKFQLVVRAESALRTILLNILLSSSVPTQRMGTNNVMLVCLPTPQDPPPPTPVLLRVKTTSDADDLLKTIDQYKH